jgi:hypothetical protein
MQKDSPGSMGNVYCDPPDQHSAVLQAASSMSRRVIYQCN